MPPDPVPLSPRSRPHWASPPLRLSEMPAAAHRSPLLPPGPKTARVPGPRSPRNTLATGPSVVPGSPCRDRPPKSTPTPLPSSPGYRPTAPDELGSQHSVQPSRSSNHNLVQITAVGCAYCFRRGSSCNRGLTLNQRPSAWVRYSNTNKLWSKVCCCSSPANCWV